MKSIIDIGPKKKMNAIPHIYITGGSTGSQSINLVVDKILDHLLKDFYVIHQTGILDFEYFSERKKRMDLALTRRYEIKSFIEPFDVWKVFKRTDILISRAGANTISEILITKRPSILIPLPWSILDEQNKNALIAKEAGIAKVLSQKDLSPTEILKNIDYVTARWLKMVNQMDSKIANVDKIASRKFVDLIENVLK